MPERAVSPVIRRGAGRGKAKLQGDDEGRFRGWQLHTTVQPLQAERGKPVGAKPLPCTVPPAWYNYQRMGGTESGINQEGRMEHPENGNLTQNKGRPRPTAGSLPDKAGGPQEGLHNGGRRTDYLKGPPLWEYAQHATKERERKWQ